MAPSVLSLCVRLAGRLRHARTAPRTLTNIATLQVLEANTPVVLSQRRWASQCASTGEGLVLNTSTVSNPQVDPNNTPIVFLHGMFGSLANFRTLSKQICEATKSKVVLVDLRNHGASPHAKAMSYPVMAEDLLHTLDELGVSSCHLIGHSMGGKVAMAAALTNPSRVEKLVVVDISPVTYHQSKRDTASVAEAMLSLPLDSGEIRTRHDADDALRIDVRNDVVRRFVLTNLVVPSRRQLEAAEKEGQHLTPYWRVNLPSLVANMATLRGFEPPCEITFDKPTMFLYGNQSDYVLESQLPKTKALFPQSTFVGIEAGHWVHSERPAEFADAVLKFLAS
eukprot:m.16838 g.16838  ORF g.16838 m.16838 type:complete len:338 (+) comp7244_c0_seq1:118-1131(+)